MIDDTRSCVDDDHYVNGGEGRKGMAMWMSRGVSG